MILKYTGKKIPKKNTLRNGEKVIVKIRPGQYSPSDQGGLYEYTRVGDKLYRVKLEEVEWEE